MATRTRSRTVRSQARRDVMLPSFLAGTVFGIGATILLTHNETIVLSLGWKLAALVLTIWFLRALIVSVCVAIKDTIALGALKRRYINQINAGMWDHVPELQIYRTK